MSSIGIYKLRSGLRHPAQKLFAYSNALGGQQKKGSYLFALRRCLETKQN